MQGGLRCGAHGTVLLGMVLCIIQRPWSFACCCAVVACIFGRVFLVPLAGAEQSGRRLQVPGTGLALVLQCAVGLYLLTLSWRHAYLSLCAYLYAP